MPKNPRNKEHVAAYNLAMKTLKIKYRDEFELLLKEARMMLGVPYTHKLPQVLDPNVMQLLARVENHETRSL